MIGAALLALAVALPSSAPASLAPSFEEVKAAWRPSDVALLDRRGDVVQELRLDRTRRRLAWVPLADVSPAVIAAVLASEDRRFYRHDGVDYRALAVAALGRLTGGPPRGASTISMQVAALVDPELRRRGRPRDLALKWRQMRLAWELETGWSKARILETYLNLVTFRGELQGIGAASTAMFGKAPHGVTEAEAAVMAALLRAPGAGAESVARRARAVAAAQGRAVGGEVTAPTTARALAGSARGPTSADAPHAARRLLQARGRAAVPPGAAAAAGALRSTLDAPTQRLAAESLRRHLLAVRGERVHDGAVLVVDNPGGDVLAYVVVGGSPAGALHVDAVQARRQAGSALKPFLYAAAIDRRLLTAASLLEDTPLEIAVSGGLYRPRNYDEQFRGLVSARTALGSSLNVPAVRALRLLGEEEFARRLRALGFEGLQESGEFYGPALALGAADVSLWELAGAYRALAAGGRWSPLRLDAAAGRPRWSRRVYSEAAAFVVGDMLADRESRSATFGLENALATPFWAAVKTGTSKDMRDNWCVGFSRRYTVGVWVGNVSGEPMRNVSGVTGAAPVWLELMTWLHRGETSRAPAPPAGVARAAVAFGQAAEPPRAEWFVRGTEPGPAPASPARAAGAARIVAPVAGTVVALDPDIPAGRQRVAFEARAAGPQMRWVLDGVDVGSAADLVLWPPRPGRHTLVVRDDVSARDAVTFEVRGQAAERGP